ncbi:MAG: ADOP family duplicated permease [Vicinamibacterales bacterium]
MRPDERDLDDELRGHLALAVQERIARGESPEAARLAALRDLGYMPAVRDSMRRVWYGRWADALSALGQDLRVGARSLLRARGLSATVVVTLALGIGANAAIFSVIRGVLLRPLVNRDEDRLVYIRQGAPGLGADNITFSVPEIDDFASGARSIAAFGDFSTIDFTLVGLGPEPRVVHAGVVSGTFFDVMGLRPVLGRLLSPADDGEGADGAVVLTHRFWSTALDGDPSVIGRTVRLGPRAATIVGVLEPSVPYPADTEIIANIVTSPHHLGATMVTERTHRMTELFGRLAPGATVEGARAEIAALHAAMKGAHPEAYPASSDIRVTTRPLRDQITAPARTVLLILLAAAAVVFVIACSNVANLILARSVRREGELAVRAALGASTGALRRTLLAESLILCGAGAVLGVLLARPAVSLVARYAARFSVRALDVTIDTSVLWVGAGLAMAAAVALAYVPRLPSAGAPAGLAPSGGAVRLTPATTRRLRVFAVTQIALSFVLLTGAAMLVAALIALQGAPTGIDTRRVLAVDLPPPDISQGVAPALYEPLMRRIGELPGVTRVAIGSFVPWRDAGSFGPGFQFSVEGYARANGEEDPRARLRSVSPGFFAALGVPILAGRDFTEADRAGAENVAIVSESVARRMFPSGDALNRVLLWTDSLFTGFPPRRIVGVVGDIDDENVVAGPALTVYHPYRQFAIGGRLFVHATGDPYALAPLVRRIVRDLAADQPVERPATLEDVRAEVLAPDRVNALVIAGFAGTALLIAVVGVAGVLAFSVSTRTREFGVRLAVGSSPRHLLVTVLVEGLALVAGGLAAGAAGGYALGLAAARVTGAIALPAPVPAIGAAALLVAAAVVASLLPAARAARVDVMRALRTE